MAELIIDSFLLIRSPAYSYENFTRQFLEESLQMDFFRAALFFASQPFFMELRKKNFDYGQLTDSAKTTLWKYLNRMCFRSLPYGLFASYSAGRWAEEEQQEKMSFTDDGKLTVHPDFKVVFDFISQLKIDDFDLIRYYNNNSMYESIQQLRFISQAYSSKNKFVIAQLKLVPGLKKLFKFTSKGRTKQAIIEFLREEYGDEVPVNDYFQSLLEGQLIVSELTPNVTGPNYNQRCLELLKDYPVTALNQLKSFETTLNTQIKALPVLSEYVDCLVSRNTENATYSLYQRKISGGVNKNLKNRISCLINQLDKLTADQDIAVMDTFKSKFKQKYGEKEVPLMVVLDPETGIGYENLATAFDAQNDDFIGDLHNREEIGKTAGWGKVEKLLFKKWNALSKSGLEKIILTEEELKELPESGHSLAPGMFMLFKNIDQEIWIDNIGGVSGIELTARFGTTDPGITHCLKNICEQEMAVNHEYIFAEIAFSPNDRSSNINQRRHFYTYEIPVLTHSTLPEEHVIRLNDLMVAVVDNKVLLRSARLDRYIIPRLSSAYNYQLTTIPVFKFLCDLQFQGVKSNMTFALSDFFPDLGYYPRVQLGTVVLSPATWLLNEQQLKDIQENEQFLKEELYLPDYFSLLEGDNFLVFDRNNANDLNVFRKCVRNKKTAKLVEYVFAQEPDLRNAEGQPFVSQLVASIINQSKSYDLPKHQLIKYAEKKDIQVKRSFLPGEEWLYIKLYAHPSLTDEILLNFIIPVLRKYKKDNQGFKWFFIRYQDPDHHLRLRFFTVEKSPYILMAELMLKLQPWVKLGKIADVRLEPYQRELEKYSFTYIHEVESFFYNSTELILTTFSSHEATTAFRISFAVNTSLQIIQCFIPDDKQRTEFFKELLQNFSGEFNRDKEVSRKLDIKYRKFQQELIANDLVSVVRKNRKEYKNYISAAVDLSAKFSVWEKTDQYDLLINLVHVHINRIFSTHPREYEYLIYHFMKKHQAYLKYTASA